jgi:hypothetical protein
MLMQDPDANRAAGVRNYVLASRLAMALEGLFDN